MDNKHLNDKRGSKDLGILLASEAEPQEIGLNFIKATLDYFRAERVKDKFNGNNVSEWTGLTGKELGNFMSDYRGEDREAFQRMVDSLKLEQLTEDVKRSYEMWKLQ
jgi:hypothetical protein